MTQPHKNTTHKNTAHQKHSTPKTQHTKNTAHKNTAHKNTAYQNRFGIWRACHNFLVIEYLNAHSITVLPMVIILLAMLLHPKPRILNRCRVNASINTFEQYIMLYYELFVDKVLSVKKKCYSKGVDKGNVHLECRYCMGSYRLL